MALLSNLYPGIKGAQGIQGVQGTRGPQGIQGTQGIQGKYVQGFNVTTINSPYTLQTTDVGNLIKINSTSSPVSISSNTFSFGNSFMVYNGTSTKQTISQGIGVSFYSNDGTALIGDKTLKENEMTTILCSSNNNEFIFSGAYSNDIVKSGLVLLLDAGNSASYSGSGTTWNDLSGNGNHANLVNGIGYTSSNGGSLIFDGVDDYVSPTGLTDAFFQANWTASFWINFDRLDIINAGTQSISILQHGTNATRSSILLLQIDSEILFTLNNDSVDDFASLTTGTFYNVVITLNNTTYEKRIYFNGNLLARNIGGGPYIGTGNNTVIGGTLGFAGVPFDGFMSSCSFYNRVLSDFEIKHNYTVGQERFIP